jgi:hypothetical protein
MLAFISDRRFIVGALAGAFVVPYIMKTVSLRMAARTAVVSA